MKLDLKSSTISHLESWWRAFLGVAPSCELSIESPVVVSHPGLPNLGDWNGLYILALNRGVIISSLEPLKKEVARRLSIAGSHFTFETVVEHLADMGQIVGPAFIGYRDSELSFNHQEVLFIPLDQSDTQYQLFRDECTSDEWNEAGLAEKLRVIGVFYNGRLGALAGYERFEKPDSRLAQIGVIVHPSMRGQGLGEAAGKSLVNILLNEGLIPQYRALRSNSASMRLSAKLGFQHFADQGAIRLCN
jgi:RimJ/RimL family protein N-acetyltransferase